ncbi:MAG: virulence protein [Clostridiales bacterium]|nr:virulence protein [Clostridiales bacterium]
MQVRYNATGAKRKELVKAIAAITGAEAEYQGAPTFSYRVDYFTITKDGTLEFSDRSDTEEVEAVLSGLAEAGFECEPQEKAAEAAEAETTGLTIEIPLDKVNAANLTKLLEAKGELIKKALGVSDIRIDIGEDRVSFPWFTEMPDADSAKAYTYFILALCRMSVEQKRVTAKAKETENEKYEFRCFLLRLGFIGEEFKTERKILLKNLTGSSAFKGGAGHDISEQ